MTAHAHAFDPQTGEVIDLPTKTVPLDKYRELTAERDHYQAALKEAEADLRSKRRIVTQLRGDLEDFLDGWTCEHCGHKEDRAPDSDEIRKFLKYVAKLTGRDGTTGLPKMKITLASENAKWYRHIRARGYSPRDACVAMLGMMRSEFHVKHDLTFVKYVCSSKGHWSEATFDKHLRHGRLVLNEGETVADAP